MKNKKFKLPPAYAAETKDSRFAGTFEVLVPVLGRNKPHKVPLQFKSLNEAQAWLHSAEGRETVAEIVDSSDEK
jgi:antibiotic biosynthesis monooxygenase (ABM) superfamily enzyme